MTTPLRFAVFGAGFWARYQLGAWRELAGAECVAIYNRTRVKAETLDMGHKRMRSVFIHAAVLPSSLAPRASTCNAARRVRSGIALTED